MFEYLKKGDVITAPITFSDLVGSKIRPMLVLHHDRDYQELTVVYISSVIPAHPSTYDILILLGSPSGIKAGLRENSVIIARWITVIKRIHVKRKIGEADDDLRARVNNVVPVCLAI